MRIAQQARIDPFLAYSRQPPAHFHRVTGPPCARRGRRGIQERREQAQDGPGLVCCPHPPGATSLRRCRASSDRACSVGRISLSNLPAHTAAGSIRRRPKALRWRATCSASCSERRHQPGGAPRPFDRPRDVDHLGHLAKPVIDAPHRPGKGAFQCDLTGRQWSGCRACPSGVRSDRHCGCRPRAGAASGTGRARAFALAGAPFGAGQYHGEIGHPHWRQNPTCRMEPPVACLVAASRAPCLAPTSEHPRRPARS